MPNIKLVQDIRVFFNEVGPYLNKSVCSDWFIIILILLNFSIKIVNPLFYILTEFPATSTWSTWQSIIWLVLEFINVYVPYLALKPGESERPSPTKSKAILRQLCTITFQYCLYTWLIEGNNKVFWYWRYSACEKNETLAISSSH